jgi:NAD(P)-dependent dehydrogenase (short-subunit alcohol dehydrogenase family)
MPFTASVEARDISLHQKPLKDPEMSQGKVIIVTGASRGIGLAASRYLLSQGHKIVAVARSKSPLEQLAAESPDQVLPLAEDLSSLTAGKSIVEHTLQKWKRIDGVVINHGTLDPIKRVANTSAEEWRTTFDINVFSGISLVCRTTVQP